MDVVVLSSTRWSSARLSKQHLADALAGSGHRVLYVDPPVSPLSVLRQPDRLGELVGRSMARHGGVDVWTPRALPGQNRRLPQRVNSWRIGDRVEKWQARSPAERLTVAFGLEARSALGRMEGVRVYHCTDSWEDHPAIEPGDARRWEDEMLRAADIVVACSLPLVARFASRGVAARYLPHGVDVEAFRPSARGDGRPLDPELAGLARPLVGYAGGLNFRLDPGLLEAALEAVGDGTLVLIGGRWRSARGELDPATAALLEHPRVHTTGHRDGAALVAAIATLDVGLVPYTMTAFNRCSFPLKIPQYLAAGVPVVSTPNGATDEYGDLVHVVDDRAAFGAAVAEAVDGRGSGADERRRVVWQRSWHVVAQELVQHAGAPQPTEPHAG